jgi:hypothetical protein
MLLRAATLDQLARNHFASRKTALNRLRLLVRGGYLSREAVPLLDQPQPTSVYTLTTQGDDALRRLSLLSERILDA